MCHLKTLESVVIVIHTHKRRHGPMVARRLRILGYPRAMDRSYALGPQSPTQGRGFWFRRYGCLCENCGDYKIWICLDIGHEKMADTTGPFTKTTNQELTSKIHREIYELFPRNLCCFCAQYKKERAIKDNKISWTKSVKNRFQTFSLIQRVFPALHMPPARTRRPAAQAGGPPGTWIRDPSLRVSMCMLGHSKPFAHIHIRLVTS